jgi:HAMP domain-containing protein
MHCSYIQDVTAMTADPLGALRSLIWKLSGEPPALPKQQDALWAERVQLAMKPLHDAADRLQNAAHQHTPPTRRADRPPVIRNAEKLDSRYDGPAQEVGLLSAALSRLSRRRPD